MGRSQKSLHSYQPLFEKVPQNSNRFQPQPPVPPFVLWSGIADDSTNYPTNQTAPVAAPSDSSTSYISTHQSLLKLRRAVSPLLFLWKSQVERQSTRAVPERQQGIHSVESSSSLSSARPNRHSTNKEPPKQVPPTSPIGNT